jgi:hypothetical protein
MKKSFSQLVSRVVSNRPAGQSKPASNQVVQPKPVTKTIPTHPSPGIARLLLEQQRQKFGPNQSFSYVPPLPTIDPNLKTGSMPQGRTMPADGSTPQTRMIGPGPMPQTQRLPEPEMIRPAPLPEVYTIPQEQVKPYKKGGMVSSASKRGDGIAKRGRTNCKVY